jgi:hypothetical protein
MLRDAYNVKNNPGRVVFTTEEIKNFLDKLPDDIKKYIYLNFFELELKFTTINQHIMIDCSSLTSEPTKKLKKYVKIIMNNKKLKEMFLEKSATFKCTYNYIKNNDIVYDIAVNDPYYNFAIYWTFHEHH